MQRPIRRDESEDGSGEELLDWRAVVVWQSRERPDLSHAARVANGHLAARPGRALLRFAVRASHARSRSDVGTDLAGPDGASRLLPGRQWRTDYARRYGRRVLQHVVRDHGVAAGERRDLDGRERWSVLRHA